MSQFSKLKPVVVAVSVASAMVFTSSALANYSKPITPISAEAVKMNAALDQNQGGVVEGVRNRPDWVERINVSGLINVDAVVRSRTPVLRETDVRVDYDLYAARLDAFGRKKTATDIALADANLFVDAKVNNWVNTHVGLQLRENRGLQALQQFRKGNNFDAEQLARYDAHGDIDDAYLDGTAYFSDFSTEEAEGRLRVDEAYFTIGNLEQNPFYLRAGRMYVPFGKYQRYQITDPLTKYLSATSATALELGAVSECGLSGAIYGFRGTPRQHHSFGYNDDPYCERERTNGRIRVENWGAQVAYAQEFGESCNYDLGVGYLNNMGDVDFIQAGLRNKVHKRVGAYSLHGDLQLGEWDFEARYVSALDNFGGDDVPLLYDHGDDDDDRDSKPWAFAIDAGYSFDAWDHHSRFGLTYQKSKHTRGLGPWFVGLPKTRYGAEWQTNLMRNVDFVLDVHHDKGFAHRSGWSGDNEIYNVRGREHHGGRSVTVGAARLSVAFS